MATTFDFKSCLVEFVMSEDILLDTKIMRIGRVGEFDHQSKVH